MRVLVVGAGAVGGYFGARLVESGADVAFLVRGARREYVRTHGIRLAGVDGSVSSITVATTTSDELDHNYDLILLAVKGTALTAALPDLGRAIGGGSAILPMLNGIRHLRILEERFGTQRLLGGVGIVATELEQDGLIRQIAPSAGITFGELDGTSSERVQTIADVFAPASFDSRLSTTIVQDMWEKWFFMAAGGAATVLLGGAAGSILAVDDGRALIAQIIEESASLVGAEGHVVRAQARATVEGALTTPGSPFATSLYRDFAAARPTEVEPILGDLLRLGAARGLSTPLLAAATVRLRVHEATLRVSQRENAQA